MYNPLQVEYMAFPRAYATSEVLWLRRMSRDFGKFKSRVQRDLPYLDSLGVNNWPLDD
jgi:hexosaminidase